MSANGDSHTSTAMPRTPSRSGPGAPSDTEPTPPSSDTLTSKRDSFLTTVEGDILAPPPPFLAYARRVRSFSSPLKANRARYLLTFVDAETARQWWQLMQTEYPDSMRESSQLFSFKSDRVPSKAWENPEFAHLKEKWSYRQLDEKENLPEDETPVRPLLAQKRGGKRGSLMRMLSTPALGTIGEAQQTQRNDTYPNPTPGQPPEDPFTIPTPPGSTKDLIDMAGLNSTLDRMQMMMNQTNLRIDTLAERQQTYADSMDRIQQALESTMMQIQNLTMQYSAGGMNTKNMRSAIEANASHVRTVLEHQASDTTRIESMSHRMEAGFQRLDGLAETQRVSLLEIQETKLSGRQTADRVQTILDRQHAGDEKLDRLVSALDQGSESKRPSSIISSPTPSAGGMQRLQTAIEQQQTQLQGLIAAQKASNKIVSKMQASISTPPEPRVDETKRMEELQAAHVKEMAKLRRDMSRLMDDRIEKLHAAQSEHFETLLKKLDEKTTPTVVQCGHDVAPAPRKMNRELAGYWYKRV